MRGSSGHQVITGFQRVGRIGNPPLSTQNPRYIIGLMGDQLNLIKNVWKMVLKIQNFAQTESCTKAVTRLPAMPSQETVELNGFFG